MIAICEAQRFPILNRLNDCFEVRTVSSTIVGDWQHRLRRRPLDTPAPDWLQSVSVAH